MDSFIKQLHKINGHEVIICTTHKWFGKQKYKCRFYLIDDINRIGFKIKNSEIYLLKSEIISFEKIGQIFCMKDSLMTVTIMLIM